MTDAVLLQLNAVSKRFGQVVVADGLSFSVAAGATLGIVGPNGAGKTSLFGMISGDLPVDSGDIEFDGRSVVGTGTAQRCRLGITRTFQVPRPFDGLTVFENVLVAAQQGGRAATSRRRRCSVGRTGRDRAGRSRQPDGRPARICFPANASKSPARCRRSLDCCCSTKWRVA